MSQINTSVEVIEIGKKIIQKFEGMAVGTATKLNQIYKNAGESGWNDNQYHNLGIVINDCTKELMKPIGQLDELKNKLEQLKKVVEEYSK